MCRDAAVALAYDTNRERIQFAPLRVEPSGLGAGFTQLPNSPARPLAEPPEIVNRLQQIARDTGSNRASSSTALAALA